MDTLFFRRIVMKVSQILLLHKVKIIVVYWAGPIQFQYSPYKGQVTTVYCIGPARAVTYGDPIRSKQSTVDRCTRSCNVNTVYCRSPISGCVVYLHDVLCFCVVLL